jgi:dienelactone hydrolase
MGEIIFHTYPNTQHWFFENDQPESYNEVAAGVAWERTILFLRKKLRENMCSVIFSSFS